MSRRFRATIDSLQLTTDRSRQHFGHLSNVNCQRFRKGQSIIEVVVGISVVVILAISLITTMLITQRTARSAQNNTLATKLAQQTIEQVRIFRDRNSDGFEGLDVGDCWILNTSAAIPANWQLEGGSNCPGEKVLNNVKFNWKISIESVDVNKRMIIVTVTWLESGGTLTVTNKTFLTNWLSQ